MLVRSSRSIYEKLLIPTLVFRKFSHKHRNCINFFGHHTSSRFRSNCSAVKFVSRLIVLLIWLLSISNNDIYGGYGTVVRHAPYATARHFSVHFTTICFLQPGHDKPRSSSTPLLARVNRQVKNLVDHWTKIVIFKSSLYSPYVSLSQVELDRCHNWLADTFAAVFLIPGSLRIRPRRKTGVACVSHSRGDAGLSRPGEFGGTGTAGKLSRIGNWRQRRIVGQAGGLTRRQTDRRAERKADGHDESTNTEVLHGAGISAQLT